MRLFTRRPPEEEADRTISERLDDVVEKNAERVERFQKVIDERIQQSQESEQALRELIPPHLAKRVQMAVREAVEIAGSRRDR